MTTETQPTPTDDHTQHGHGEEHDEHGHHDAADALDEHGHHDAADTHEEHGHHDAHDTHEPADTHDAHAPAEEHTSPEPGHQESEPLVPVERRGLFTRLLTQATVADALNPNAIISSEITVASFQDEVHPEAKVLKGFMVMNASSTAERYETWKNQTDAMNKWKRGITSAINHPANASRKAALLRLGNVANFANFTVDNAQKLHEKYLSGPQIPDANGALHKPDKLVAVTLPDGTMLEVTSQMESFVRDVVMSYTQQTGTNKAQLLADLDTITWVGRIFGEQNSLVVKNCTEAILARAEDPAKFIAEANAETTQQVVENGTTVSRQVKGSNYLDAEARTVLGLLNQYKDRISIVDASTFGDGIAAAVEVDHSAEPAVAVDTSTVVESNHPITYSPFETPKRVFWKWRLAILKDHIENAHFDTLNESQLRSYLIRLQTDLSTLNNDLVLPTTDNPVYQDLHEIKQIIAHISQNLITMASTGVVDQDKIAILQETLADTVAYTQPTTEDLASEFVQSYESFVMDTFTKVKSAPTHQVKFFIKDVYEKYLSSQATNVDVADLNISKTSMGIHLGVILRNAKARNEITESEANEIKSKWDALMTKMVVPATPAAPTAPATTQHP